MRDDIYLVVGLGNPGEDYRQTRHNVGFMVVDYLAAELSAACWKNKFNGSYCKVTAGGKDIFLLKPETYMNRSGECVSAFVRFFKIPLNGIVVTHDDLDLDFGRLKVVAKGGSGGHNGIRSIASHLGSNDFVRVKIGVGRPPPGYPVDKYVLSRFSSEERDCLAEVVSEAARAIKCFVEKGISQCMNQFNRKR